VAGLGKSCSQHPLLLIGMRGCRENWLLARMAGLLWREPSAQIPLLRNCVMYNAVLSG